MCAHRQADRQAGTATATSGNILSTLVVVAFQGWHGPDVGDIINNWGDNRGAEHVFYASVHMGVCVCERVRAGQNKLMADFSPCFDGIKSPLLLNVPR